MAKFCRYCGNKMNDDAMFCRACGKNVGAPQQNIQQQPVQQPVEQSVQPQFQQMQYQPQPVQQPKQKAAKGPVNKKKLGRIIGIACGALAMVGLIAFIVIAVANANPKKAFIKYSVETAKNVDSEISQFGAYQIESLFHVRADQDISKHTLYKNTTLVSDGLDGKTVAFTQKYAYDKSSGDTSYEIGLTLDGESAGTSGIYFSGNEFIFDPFETSEPMVKYEMDSDMAESLKEYGAVDRFAYMVKDENGPEEFDWEAAQEDFEESLEDLDKSDFDKDKEEIELLGKNVTCDTVTVELEGEEASAVLDTFIKMISGNNSGYDEYQDYLDEILESGKEDVSGLQLTMTTYAYKKKAVGVSLVISDNGSTSNMKLVSYATDDEKQVNLNFTNGKEEDDFVYVNSIINTGGKNYEYYTNVDTNGMVITISEDGKRSGDKISLSGDFTINTGELLEDKVIKGTLSHDYDGDEGTITTSFDIDESTKNSLDSEITNDTSTADVDFPEFIEGSGVDAGTDLEKLKEALGDSFEMDTFKSNNPTLNNLGVFMLLMDGAEFLD